MESVSLLEACRTCANFYVNEAEIGFVDLFTPEASLEQEVAFIRSQLQNWQLQPHPDDGMPHRICGNCFGTFCNVLSFRQDCVNAQERLMQAIMQAQQENNGLCLTVENTDDLQVMLGNELLNIEHDLENTNLLQTTGLSEDMNFIANLLQTNQEELPETQQQQQGEEEEQVVVEEEEEEAKINNNNINSENLNNNEVMNDLNAINVCTTVPTNMNSLDLEDMLESSIIPKIGGNLNTNEIAAKQLTDNDNGEEEQEEEQLSARIAHMPYACQYCHCPETGSIDHLIFTNSDSLSKHYFDVHDPDRPYNCPICTSIFETANKREKHVSKCAVKKNPTQDMLPISPNNLDIMLCVFCKETVPGSLELHELHCGYLDNWTCTICEQLFENTPLYMFRNHQRSHTPGQLLKCRHCTRSFISAGSLACHERVHYSNEPGQIIQCEICFEPCTSEVMLHVHKIIAHSEKKDRFCTICNESFASRAFYLRHQEEYHPLPDNKSCNNCGKYFSSAKKLRNHLDEERDENGQCMDTILEPPAKRSRKNNMLVCKFCAIRFSTDEQLEKHLTTHDPKERPLSCSACQVRCRNEKELEEHIHIAHDLQSRFKCATCNQVFKSRKILDTHMATHLVMKVKCSEKNCKFIAASNKALMQHKLRRHKLLPCSKCEGFFTAEKLKQHLISEHGVDKNVENGEKESTANVYYTDETKETEEEEEHSQIIPNGQNGNTNGIYDTANNDFFELPQMPTLAVDIQQNQIINNNNKTKEPEQLTLSEFPVLITSDGSPNQYYFNIDTDHEIIIT